MLDYHEHGCGSVGKWIGVLCAALGVVTAYVMVRAMNIGWDLFPSNPPKEILVGLVVLFLAAAYLGEKSGRRLCGKDHDLPLNVVVGLGVAFGSITIAVMSGTMVGVVSNAGEWLSSPDYNPLYLVPGFFFLLFFILLFGGLPALILGVLYGFLVRSRLRNLNCS
jgi:hypothetical protein